MMKIRQREFAQLEEPIRMAGPLDVEIITEIELQRNLLSDEFVDNGPVIDAIDRDLTPAIPVVQLAAVLNYRGNVYRCNAARSLRHQEIALRLLVLGIDFEQHHVLRIAVA